MSSELNLDTNVCPLCAERGKTWNGSDPRCAFPGGQPDSPFNGDNWNCAAMNALRDITCDRGRNHRDDMDAGSFGYVWYPGGYIAMSWYKSRYTTPVAMLFNDDATPRTITLQDALDAIAANRKRPF